MLYVNDDLQPNPDVSRCCPSTRARACRYLATICCPVYLILSFRIGTLTEAQYDEIARIDKWLVRRI